MHNPTIAIISNERYSAGSRDMWLIVPCETLPRDFSEAFFSEFITTHRPETNDWTDRLRVENADALERSIRGLIVPTLGLVERRFTYTSIHVRLNDGQSLYDAVRTGNLLMGWPLAHPQALPFCDEMPVETTPRFFVVRSPENFDTFLVCSLDEWEGAVETRLPSGGDTFWTGYTREISAEVAEAATAMPDGEKQRRQVVTLLEYISAEVRSEQDFLKQVGEKAREAKIRGWCGEVEKMLAESEVPTTTTVNGTVYLQLEVEDFVVPLGSSTNNGAVLSYLTSRAQEALQGAFRQADARKVRLSSRTTDSDTRGIVNGETVTV